MRIKKLIASNAPKITIYAMYTKKWTLYLSIQLRYWRKFRFRKVEGAALLDFGPLYFQWHRKPTAAELEEFQKWLENHVSST